MRAPFLFFCCLFAFYHLQAQVQNLPTCLTGLSQPVDLTHAGDGTNRLFVVEKAGTIKVFAGCNTTGSTFLNITGLIGSDAGERGLLGLAFHPNYASNGYFYVHYTNTTNGVITSRISRFSASAGNPDQADPNSEFILLTIAQPYNNHNGGDLQFSPIDGYLYISLGDGGSGGDPQNNAHDLSTLLGKILRIDVDNGNPYGVPASNPFVGVAGAEPEIWSYGWRNPWRFSFDAQTGDMWIGDVGQDSREEIDFELAGNGGLNYGWDCFEGNITHPGGPHCDPLPSNTVAPVHDYTHINGQYSVTGGFVYRGSNFPNLQGYYLFAEYEQDILWTLNPANNQVSVQNVPGVSNVASFGEGEDGELYMLSIFGTVRSVAGQAPLPVSLLDFSGHHAEGKNILHWSTASEQNSAYFEVEKQQASGNWQSLAKEAAAGFSQQELNYRFVDETPLDGSNYYRLKQVDIDGSSQYSNIVEIRKPGSTRWQVFPNPARDHIYLKNDQTKSDVLDIRLYNTLGETVMVQQFADADEAQRGFSVRGLTPGLYWMQLEDGSGQQSQRLIIK